MATIFQVLTNFQEALISNTSSNSNNNNKGEFQIFPHQISTNIMDMKIDKIMDIRIKFLWHNYRNKEFK